MVWNFQNIDTCSCFGTMHGHTHTITCANQERGSLGRRWKVHPKVKLHGLISVACFLVVFDHFQICKIYCCSTYYHDLHLRKYNDKLQNLYSQSKNLIFEKISLPRQSNTHAQNITWKACMSLLTFKTLCNGIRRWYLLTLRWRWCLREIGVGVRQWVLSLTYFSFLR